MSLRIVLNVLLIKICSKYRCFYKGDEKNFYVGDIYWSEGFSKSFLINKKACL